MSEQPKATRLAEQLETFNPVTFQCSAAAELRRLHSLNAELLEALKDIVALWDHHCYAHGDGQPSPLHVKACAAIAKSEGVK